MRTIETLPARSGRPALYNWDDILNGEVNVLDNTEDFPTATPDSFVSHARGVAKDRGLKVEARTQGEGLAEGEVAIQAVPATDDE